MEPRDLINISATLAAAALFMKGKDPEQAIETMMRMSREAARTAGLSDEAYDQLMDYAARTSEGWN